MYKNIYSCYEQSVRVLQRSMQFFSAFNAALENRLSVLKVTEQQAVFSEI